MITREFDMIRNRCCARPRAAGPVELPDRPASRVPALLVSGFLAATIFFPLAPSRLHALEWLGESSGRRARLVVETPRRSSSLDAAAVTLFTGGRHLPGGADLRVFDRDSREVPWVLLADRGESLEILFRVGPGQLDFTAYFDDPSAAPPEYAWEPVTGGLFMESRERAGARPSNNLRQVRQAFEEAGPVIGRGPRPRIDDTENPFGRNNLYLNYYHGYLEIPEKGVYWFSTNSSDSSFLLLDGHEAVSWPGRHPKDGGASRPRQNEWSRRRPVTLEKGVYRIEYFHEHGTGPRLARAGWRRPGEEVFSIIPDEAFIERLGAVQVSLERPGERLSAFFSVRPVGALSFHGTGLEATRLRFTPHLFHPRENISLAWRFGDRAVAPGTDPEMVFRSGTTVPVTLTVAGPNGSTLASSSRTVEVPSRAKADNFRVQLEISTRQLVYGPSREIVVEAGAGNYTVRPVEIGFSARAADRAGRPLELPGATREVAAHGFTEFSFTLPLETARVEVSLDYEGLEIARREIAVVTPADPLPSFSFEGARAETEDGRYLLLRLGETGRARPPRDRPAGPKVFLSPAGRSIPGTTFDLGREISRLSVEAGGPPVESVEYDDRVAQHSPLAALARGAETILLGPRLVIFMPGPQEIEYHLDLQPFRHSLAFLARFFLERGTRLLFVVPPPVLGRPGESTAVAAAIKEVALAEGVPVVDSFILFPPAGLAHADHRYRLGRSNIFSDQPNAEGQAALAAWIHRRAREVMEQD